MVVYSSALVEHLVLQQEIIKTSDTKAHVGHQSAGKLPASPISLKELAKHTTESDCWIAHRGRVYDVSKFLHDHPAGSELILEHAGTDVTQVMADEAAHMHSDGAYDMLVAYFVGYLEGASVFPDAAGKSCASTNNAADDVACLDSQLTEELASAKKPLLDLQKPLLYQMLNSTFSKEFYMTQVHIPRHLPEPATIFANPFLEILTRTPWYVVPSVWVPVVLFLASTALQQMTAFELAACSVFGLFVWTLCEYTFHRFLFHVDSWLPDHPYALTLHFLLHGVHHYLPMDRMRLVMPPVLFAALAFLPFCLSNWLLGFTLSCGIFTGAISGYIIYDLFHYYLHHARVLTAYARSLKRYHLAHHYKDSDSGYGITSKLWDYICGTVLDDSPSAARKKV